MVYATRLPHSTGKSAVAETVNGDSCDQCGHGTVDDDHILYYMYENYQQILYTVDDDHTLHCTTCVKTTNKYSTQLMMIIHYATCVKTTKCCVE